MFTDEERKSIFWKFKEKYPNYRGLDLATQKKVLDGDLVIVNVSGTKKFRLMTREDVAPGGKLDQMNEKTRRANAKIRAHNKAVKARTAAAFNALINGDYETFDNFLFPKGRQ